jgi:hypothetical protein
MAWKDAGRPGRFGRSRDRWRRLYDDRFGPGRWRVVHRYLMSDLDLPGVGRLYERAYLALFRDRPQLLAWLARHARDVYATAPSNTRSGGDYTVQERKVEHVHDIAIRNTLRAQGRSFEGERLLRIARAGPGAELHPGRVPFPQPEAILEPRLIGPWDDGSLEQFWESNRVLQVWEGEAPPG